MSFPVGRLADAVEVADESVAGGGGMIGVARASLNTDEAIDKAAEEQRSPVLDMCQTVFQYEHLLTLTASLRHSAC